MCFGASYRIPLLAKSTSSPCVEKYPYCSGAVPRPENGEPPRTTLRFCYFEAEIEEVCRNLPTETKCQTVWRWTQSRANLSPPTDSLLTGKNPGDAALSEDLTGLKPWLDSTLQAGTLSARSEQGSIGKDGNGAPCYELIASGGLRMSPIRVKRQAGWRLPLHPRRVGCLDLRASLETNSGTASLRVRGAISLCLCSRNLGSLLFRRYLLTRLCS